MRVAVGRLLLNRPHIEAQGALRFYFSKAKENNSYKQLFDSKQAFWHDRYVPAPRQLISEQPQSERKGFIRSKL